MTQALKNNSYLGISLFISKALCPKTALGHMATTHKHILSWVKEGKTMLAAQRDCPGTSQSKSVTYRREKGKTENIDSTSSGRRPRSTKQENIARSWVQSLAKKRDSINHYSKAPHVHTVIRGTACYSPLHRLLGSRSSFVYKNFIVCNTSMSQIVHDQDSHVCKGSFPWFKKYISEIQPASSRWYFSKDSLQTYSSMNHLWQS